MNNNKELETVSDEELKELFYIIHDAVDKKNINKKENQIDKFDGNEIQNCEDF